MQLIILCSNTIKNCSADQVIENFVFPPVSASSGLWRKRSWAGTRRIPHFPALKGRDCDRTRLGQVACCWTQGPARWWLGSTGGGWGSLRSSCWSWGWGALESSSWMDCTPPPGFSSRQPVPAQLLFLQRPEEAETGGKTKFSITWSAEQFLFGLNRGW